MSSPAVFEGDMQSEAVRIWLLGGFRVSVGSRTIRQDEWRLKKAAALVKLLALAPGHRMHREQIMDLLWPDSGRTAASNSLRKTLHAARNVFDPATGASYLASEEESLALCPDSDLWVDVDAFEEAVAMARRSRDPAAHRAALDLYGGELLPGDRYEGWAEEHRNRLRETYLSLLLELARLHEERGDYESAVEALRSGVTEEPSREEAHVGLMRLYAHLGASGEALAQYGRLEEALLRELGTEPSASSRALREEITTGRFPPKVAPSLAYPSEEELGAGMHNLPAARTSFVGRGREMLGVRRDLAMTRLLTLTGAGGSGKTRLALEVARDLVGAYPDGVWLVELAGLSEGGLVPREVAGALGVREQPGRPLADTLVEALRSRHLMLVVDNCEHLVEAAARLLDALLDSCPWLRVLATSREAIGLEGEVVWRVPTLSVPDPQRLQTKDLEGYESVRLFAERARQRDPSFALTPSNARAVAEICRRLGGIPLAVELAAAQVGVLQVAEIASRLGDSLGLLTGGSRTAAPRQRTLRGALDWSHDLLGKPERVVFRRLSTFAGGWLLEAAEAVAPGDGVGKRAVLGVLSRLVDKSLVVTAGTTDGGMRYGMLEPIRQYAEEKLQENEQVEEVSHRHAEFFLALAEEAEPHLRGPEQAKWLQRLEAEHDNTRAVLSRALMRGEAELGLRLAGALWRFWATRGHYDEGRRWLEAVLSNDRGRTSPLTRAKALGGLGFFACQQHDHELATKTAEEGLRLAAEVGFGGSLPAFLKSILGEVAEMRGDFACATSLYDEGLELFRQAGDRRGVASSLLDLGNASVVRGDYGQAKEFYKEGAALSRELGGSEPLGGILISWGYVCLLEGEPERAMGLNEEAAALFRAHGQRDHIPAALDNMGWAALVMGNREKAQALHEESLAVSWELVDRLLGGESIEGLACAAAAEGKTERAAKLFGAAEALREEVGRQQEPEARALRRPYLTMTRFQLGEASWEAAYVEGRAMTFEQAVEYARSERRLTQVSSVEHEPSSTGTPSDSLTSREEEVAELVARGFTNRQIAAELVVSEHTAATHVRRVLKKLGLRSRAQIGSWLSEQQ